MIKNEIKFRNAKRMRMNSKIGFNELVDVCRGSRREGLATWHD